MLTKIKIALVVALVAGSASVASAQGFDPNPANRYPQYATPGGSSLMYLGSGSRSVAPQVVVPQGTFQSAPVDLYQRRDSAPAAGRFESFGYRAQQDEIGTDLSDRASSPYAGGVN